MVSRLFGLCFLCSFNIGHGGVDFQIKFLPSWEGNLAQILLIQPRVLIESDSLQNPMKIEILFTINL